MSETTNTQQQPEVQENVQESVQENVQTFNPFSDNSWSEQRPDLSQSEQTTEQQPEQATTTSSPDTQEYEEEIVDADEWLKREFNWESADAAKAEIEELRKLRETASSQSEIEFANEQSAKFFKLLQEGKEDDLYSFLENKKKIDRLTSTDLNNTTAAEIIKLNMAQKYKDLTRDEIEYKFNKQFGIPNRPVQKDIETDEEYQDRLSNWESRARDVETELMIEAKLAKPELERFKSELVLPDIQFESQNQAQGPTQEELDAQVAMIDGFKKNVESALKSFDGFSVSVKDEEVEIPLSYSVSDEERNVVASQLERFADSNFDANAVLAERWLKEDGRGGYELNTNQIVRDLALLQSEGRINQKFVNDAAAKRLAEHIKKTSNVTVSSRTPQQTFSPEQKSDREKQIEFIWKNG
jgi:hypothetical protein